jgi:hypothetical protein
MGDVVVTIRAFLYSSGWPDYDSERKDNKYVTSITRSKFETSIKLIKAVSASKIGYLETLKVQESKYCQTGPQYGKIGLPLKNQDHWNAW